MTTNDYRNDLDALFDELGELSREQALALYGYLTGLHYSGAIETDDYRRYWERLPLTGDELSDLNINF